MLVAHCASGPNPATAPDGGQPECSYRRQTVDSQRAWNLRIGTLHALASVATHWNRCPTVIETLHALASVATR